MELDPFGEPFTTPSPIFLGVLGSHEGATEERIEEIIVLLLQCLERFPERMILPSEGRNNMYMSDWADRHKLTTQVYEADWYRHNRSARIFRDTRIIKESTHFLIFLNKRSEANEKIALRLAKQGKQVFTIHYHTWDMEELSIQRVVPEPPLSSPKERGSKRGTGKGSARKGAQTLSDHKSHSPLLALWASSCQTASPGCQSE